MTSSSLRTALDQDDPVGDPDALARFVAAWPDPVIVADRAGIVAASNHAARHLLEVRDRGGPDDVATLLGADVARALLAVGADPVERLIGEDRPVGRHPVLRAHAAAFGPRLIVIALADASGESRLRSHLGLAEKLASIGELLSSVAHELNNPLTAVLGYADLLLSEDDARVPRDEIERIRSEALRCRRIVGNLLDLARADSVDLRPLVLTEVVDKVIEVRAYACRSGGIELVRDTPETPVILGDFHRLVQAVLNLVTNAEDAVKRRPAPRVISIHTCAEGNRVRVAVDDTGEGVPSALRTHIFQPFFTTKPRGKGTGLGLSLVRDTARALGGDVRCEDAPGGGARFVMELPAADLSV